MSIEAVRAGSSQSRQNESSFGILFFELIVFSVFSGVYFASWLVGGAVFLGSLFLLFNQIARVILMISFSLAWGALGLAVGSLFDSIGASAVLGVIGLVWGFGIHIQGFQHLDDLSK